MTNIQAAQPLEVRSSVVEHPYRTIVRNLGRNVWPIRSAIQVEDLLLYGSVLRGEPNPRDIDLLVIHSSPAFDRYDAEYGRSNQQDILKVSQLVSDLGSGGSLLVSALENAGAMDLVSRNILNVLAMNRLFFTDEFYRNRWRRKNCHDPQFDARILTIGRLWNPETDWYDINVNQRYNTEEALTN